MAKLYITVSNNSRRYKLNREDIHKFYSTQKRKVPRLPAYDPTNKEQEYDSVTNYSDAEV
jgi:hypothetical protein